jgi:fused signal recognition particle receptor
MFKALKEKLFSVRQRLETTISEQESAAAPCEDQASVSAGKIPAPPASGSAQGDIPAPEKEKGKKSPSFTQKVVSLVRDREFIISSRDIDESLSDLEMGLLESDVAFSATDAILTRVREDLTGSTRKIGTSVDDVITGALSDALLSVLGEGVDILEFIESREKPVKILFTGVNGTGKTTSVAKVARFMMKNGLTVAIGAGDTFRAGAIEQIDVHGQRLGIKVIQHQDGSDPSAVLYDTVQYAKAHGIDVVLGDTAGRFHNRVNLMNQLSKIRRVIQPDLIVYVDEAVAGNDAVIRAEEFAKSVGMDAVMLTKVDMDPKGGAAISIAHAVGKPLLFIGTGQGYDDIMVFDPKTVVADLLSGDA